MKRAAEPDTPKSPGRRTSAPSPSAMPRAPNSAGPSARTRYSVSAAVAAAPTICAANEKPTLRAIESPWSMLSLIAEARPRYRHLRRPREPAHGGSRTQDALPIGGTEQASGKETQDGWKAEISRDAPRPRVPHPPRDRAAERGDGGRVPRLRHAGHQRHDEPALHDEADDPGSHRSEHQADRPRLHGQGLPRRQPDGAQVPRRPPARRRRGRRHERFHYDRRPRRSDLDQGTPPRRRRLPGRRPDPRPSRHPRARRLPGVRTGRDPDRPAAPRPGRDQLPDRRRRHRGAAG